MFVSKGGNFVAMSFYDTAPLGCHNMYRWLSHTFSWMALVGNLRLWSVQEPVSSVLYNYNVIYNYSII